MNERIKELAEQAITQNEPDWIDFRKALTGGGSLYLDVFAQKFAELIVRECMKVCKKIEQYEVGNQDPVEVGCIRAGATFCREDIKDHFGVEERPR